MDIALQGDLGKVKGRRTLHQILRANALRPVDTPATAA